MLGSPLSVSGDNIGFCGCMFFWGGYSFVWLVLNKALKGLIILRRNPRKPVRGDPSLLRETLDYSGVDMSLRT